MIVFSTGTYMHAWLLWMIFAYWVYYDHDGYFYLYYYSLNITIVLNFINEL